MSEISNQPPAAADRRAVGTGTLVIGLVFGVVLWLVCDNRWIRSPSRLLVDLLAIALCFVPVVQRGVGALAEWLDARRTVRTALVFAGIVAATVGFLYSAGLVSNRQWLPAVHDEFSYLLQARMFASGHLSMPAHPLGEFFDTFYVITDRAYASQYFPGTALLFVPGIWLGVPFWVTSLLLSGLAAGMLYLVVRELFGSGPGLAAVAMTWSLLTFRFTSLTALSQIPSLLMGLIAAYVALRWVSNRRLLWIVCLGIAIGWQAVVRPLDALAYAIPLGVLVAFTLVRDRAPLARWLVIGVAGVAPMLPFAVLQLTINHQVTGHLLQTPFAYYAERDLPAVRLGFDNAGIGRPLASRIPQKQAYYRELVPVLQRHTPWQVLDNWFPDRLSALTGIALGDRLFLLLVPLGLLTLRGLHRWAIAAILPAWCILYSFYPLFLLHYLIVGIVSALVMVFSGFEAIRRQIPHRAGTLRAMEVLLPIAVSVMIFPQINAARSDGRYRNELEPVVRRVESEITGKAVLLIRYDGGTTEWEAVYNLETAWPDDARIVRAHDLGAENAKLFEYYAQRQPDRVAYLFDRADASVTRLGSVAELARGGATATPSAAATQPSSD